MSEPPNQVPSTFRRLRALVPVVWRLGGRSGRVVAPDDLLLHRAAGALTPDEQEALLVSTLGPLMAVKRTSITTDAGHDEDAPGCTQPAPISSSTSALSSR